MPYRGEAMSGFAGHHLTVAALEALRPAADNVGRIATVGTPGDTAAYHISQGNGWEALVAGSVNPVTGGISLGIGETPYGLIYGPTTLALLPAASLMSGYMAKVSDIGGTTGTLFISDGVRWKPVNGVTTLYSSDSASSAMSGITETVQRSFLIPRGLLKVGDRLVCKISQSKSSTAETVTTRVRMGTAGTTADAQICALALMSTTNISLGWMLDLRVNSLTTVKKLGASSVNLPWGVGTGVTPAPVTVPDLSANDVYLTFTSFMSSTVETTTIEDLSIEYHSATT